MANKNMNTKITVNSTQASERTNISDSENINSIIGKIRKWFSDLGTAAFTNSTDYAAASHTQPSSTITAMTGYSKPQSTSAIAATDTLNEAIGKLEKAVDDAGGGLQPGNVDVSTNSVTLTSSSPTATVTLSNATGAVSLVYSGDNFKASLNNNIITINRAGKYREDGFILIKVAASSTYTSTVEIISVHNDGIVICSWADGTDEDIASMLESARNGYIKLSDYWSVGDERIVNNLDTSVISTSTIKLTLDEGIAYDSSDESKVSNFCIAVEGTSSYTIESLFNSASTVKLSFNKAQQIKNCLPQAITNNLLTQKISIYDKNGNTTTESTDVSYAGSKVHSNTNLYYGTNRTFCYGPNDLRYYYAYYTNNTWKTTYKSYSDTSISIRATYLMCI